MRQRRVSKTSNKKKHKDIPDRDNNQEKFGHIPWDVFPIILICLVGVIVYFNSFDCSFHFDDYNNITENVVIREISNIKAWWSFVPSRPIGYLSFALNYHFHRLDIWGYHLVNLTIHIVNAILVWWLVMLTLSTPVMSNIPIKQHKRSIALFTGLLFVSHPLATQSVTYIVQRLASLATLFYLLSLALYVKGRLWGGNKDAPPMYFYYAGSILCAVLGMLTKEILITLPFMLVLYEFSFIKTDTWKIDLKDRGIQVIIIIVGIFVALFFLNFSFKIFHTVPIQIEQGYDYSITAKEYLLTQFSVIFTYIRLLILPVNQNLDYDYPVSNSLFEMHTLLGLLSLAGIAVTGILLFRRYRLISFGIFWFFLTMSVESSIVPISQNVIFEHRTYLPSIGFFLVMITMVFYFLWDRNRQIAVGILLLLIFTNSFMTYERNKAWISDYTLWADCVKKSPNKPRPLNNYGKALADAGNVSEALMYYNKAIKMNPHYYLPYYNRGNIKIKLKDYKGAIIDYETALKINPNNANAHNNIGNILFAQRKTEEAMTHYSTAIRIDPNIPEPHFGMGRALFAQNKTAEAIPHFQEVLRTNPYHVEAYIVLGDILAEQNRLAETVDYYNKALQINHDLPEIHYNLGNILSSQKRFDEASTHFREAIRIQPDYARAHNNLGSVLLLQGKGKEAIERFREALRLQPGYKTAQDNLKNAISLQRAAK